jgi:hypothetical protein
MTEKSRISKLISFRSGPIPPFRRWPAPVPDSRRTGNEGRLPNRIAPLLEADFDDSDPNHFLHGLVRNRIPDDSDELAGLWAEANPAEIEEEAAIREEEGPWRECADPDDPD